MSNLVKRLRAYGKASENPSIVSDYSEDLALLAAAEIAALQARLAEVEAERDDLSELLDKANEQAGRNFARAERAETALTTARRDAYERAAEAINTRGAFEEKSFGLTRGTQNFYRARDIVRALIAQEEPTTN